MLVDATSEPSVAGPSTDNVRCHVIRLWVKVVGLETETSEELLNIRELVIVKCTCIV
jgi:hypothetical protein